MSKIYLDEVKDCYNKTAEEYAQKFLNELDQKPFDRNILDRFTAMVPAGGLIYDFGCGSGQITKYLQDKNLHQVVGLDFSENSISLSAKNFPEIKFIVDDMLESKMKSQSADGIAAFYAIVHFEYEDVKKALMEWHRILKPGGRCLFCFHTGEGKISVKDFLGVNGANASWILLDTDKVIDMSEQTGFRVMESVIRYPYKNIEHESKRAYIILEKMT